MRKVGFLLFLLLAILIVSSPFLIAEKAENKEAPAPIKAVEKEEPFLWDLIFSNTKSIVPMVSTSLEIALSPYEEGFIPKTQMMANQMKYTTGDRLLVQNHLWNEGDQPGDVDYYLAFADLRNPEVLFFWDGTGWNQSWAYQYLRMSVGFDRVDTIFDFRLPPNPPVGKYVFAAGLAEPGTYTFYSIHSINIEIY